MWPVSAAFTQQLTVSHTAVSLVEVLHNGSPVATLPVVSGSVTVDRTQSIRRRVQLKMTDLDGTWTPTLATDLLHPLSGNELRVWRGIVLPAGSPAPTSAQPAGGVAGAEYVPLGVFNIDTVQVDDDGASVELSIDGYDRAARVQAAKWTSLYVIASTTNVVTAIKNIISNRVSGTVFNFAVTTAMQTVLLTFDSATSDDPWKTATDLATSIGCELFYDPMGVCTLRPEPDTTTTASTWSYREGSQATFSKLGKKLSRAGVFNHIIVSGEPPNGSPAVRSEAADNNANSPTYYKGSYGDVPYFVTSPLITTQAQADTVALAQLRRLLGVRDSVSFDAIVNPAHDASDVITVQRGAAGVSAQYSLESLSIPLEPTGSMSATTRTRTVTV